MTKPDPLKSLWASSGASFEPMTPSELHNLAGKFRTKTLRRNAIEYMAAAIVIAVFGLYCFLIPLTLARLGSVMVILGTMYVVWSLHRRAGSEVLPDVNTAESMMAFHRRQLERQRDALNSIFRWYILPFLPGALVFIIGTTPEFTSEPTVLPGIMAVLPRLGFMAVVCFAVWWINKRAAQKLGDEIKSL